MWHRGGLAGRAAPLGLERQGVVPTDLRRDGTQPQEPSVFEEMKCHPHREAEPQAKSRCREAGQVQSMGLAVTLGKASCPWASAPGSGEDCPGDRQGLACAEYL